ncbi:MAG TPA: hypothetical protein GXX36_08590 [Clostridiaceae bacterium]|nr:hypothetical protein [Clostridiaceae bacterium]
MLKSEGVFKLLKAGKLIAAMILLAFMLIAVTSICYGNAAEPPSIIIIVNNAPDDLEISVGSGNTYVKTNKTSNIIESYYTFYSRDLKADDGYTIKVSTAGSTFEILLEEPLRTYNNIFTLDLKNQKLTAGKTLARSVLLVTLRIILTLLIEAVVFWLFGSRNKKSWIAFLVINLITQGALNIWINGFSPLKGYIIVSLIFGEINVFIFEIIAFLAILREHRPIRTFLYVVIANLLSLFAGGYIITVLPV